MTVPETIEQQIETMQAFADVKDIEVKNRIHANAVWYPASKPEWNWEDYAYRIAGAASKVRDTVWMVIYKNGLHMPFGSVDHAVEESERTPGSVVEKFQKRSAPKFGRLPEWANWVAMDYNGLWYAYETRPTAFTDYWADTTDGAARVKEIEETGSEYDGAWEDSLFQVNVKG